MQGFPSVRTQKWHDSRYVRLKTRSANLVLILYILLVRLGYAFYRTTGSSWEFWIWFHKEGKEVFGEAPIWCQIMSSSAPRWIFCQEDQDGHVDQIIMVKSGWSRWYEKANWSDSVIGHMADSAVLTGLTCHPHRSDLPDQSAQNANWTSPLRISRREDRNAYVECLVRSPDEGVMVLARTNSARDRSDRWDPTVWPVLAAKSELGVVFQRIICIGFYSYWGKTSPPYIYEGPLPIEENTIESINYLLFFILPTRFPTSMLLISWSPRS
jgi:hypothetical protein